MGLPALEQRTVLATLERALERAPDDVAQIDRAGRWTTAQAFDRSRRLGSGLHGLGVRPDAPVALMVDNSFDAVHTALGLALVGGVQVPVNTAYKGGFLAHVLRDSGSEVLVVEPGYVERVLAVADEVPALHTVVVLGETAPSSTRFRVIPWAELETARPADPVRRGPGDLMAIMYTSGTTGRAKGVLVPHAHAYTYASREHLERPGPGDRSLVTLPIFHLAGQWYGVYQALIHTIPCVLEPGFSVSGFWRAVREHGITYTTMLGAVAELLAQTPPAPDDADNPLELAVMAPLASDVAGFRRRFGTDVAAVYGMSEIGCVLDGPPASIVGGECGFPRTGFTLRLVDEAGEEVAPGQIGELLVRPEEPHTVMAGYHGLPEVTARTIRDGWVHTGDAFRTDAEGRFFFSDRMKDALRRRGENISSFEVESVVNAHPDVYESAVVAVPSEVGEDEIKVVVVPQQGATVDPEQLTYFLVDRLPYFMVPRYVELAAELPKTPTHKVQKARLRESGATGWDREAAGIRVRRTGVTSR
ncbi:ATP-dependent acyl-CoA ligase [Actinomycetospora sp. NBRC 106375]|uniref:AMP-binding protein n=1 Tax=Actinomycetospora sp. NBRC 106375 TaxID=3032207 RepID=UPI0024A1ABA6|nr:AMP-binding protein [Actinomycetospora sp. NBRC 106375]GLZ47910.1 ATP-dependent acyl-CoA ligase [Actinomycetospora sp. NBRC 106375]